MNVIKGVLGAVKEDKVNEWLKDHDRKVEINKTKAYPESIKERRRKADEESLEREVGKVKHEDAIKLLDRSIDECLYVGVTSHVKDQQKLMNTSMSDMVDSMSIMKDFNDWFNNYSFAYVPKFCKPLIKGWLFDAYEAGVKSNDK